MTALDLASPGYPDIRCATYLWLWAPRCAKTQGQSNRSDEHWAICFNWRTVEALEPATCDSEPERGAEGEEALKVVVYFA